MAHQGYRLNTSVAINALLMAIKCTASLRFAPKLSKSSIKLTPAIKVIPAKNHNVCGVICIRTYNTAANQKMIPPPNMVALVCELRPLG